MTVDEIISNIIKVEGGYVNHPNDPGGETKYGITVAVARANGYSGSMRDLPESMARTIYLKQYVIAPGYSPLPDSIKAKVVDCGVNMGPATASRFLQRALNALGDFRLVVDGKCGKRSQDAVQELLRLRRDGERNLLKAIDSLQCTRYIELAEGSTKNRSFINGWIANRIGV